MAVVASIVDGVAVEVKGLVLSLRNQPVEPGAREETSFDWTVPKGWETEVLRLEPGTVVPIDVAVTTIDGGVIVEANGSVTLTGECVRCLDPIEVHQDFHASEVFVYEDSRRERNRPAEGIESEGDEMDSALLIERDTVDLERLLRDAILAEAPLQPVCSEDCLGICVHCGILLRDAGPDHKHEFLDPRFAALEGFFGERDESEPRD